MSDDMEQEVWVTIRFKGYAMTSADLQAEAEKIAAIRPETAITINVAEVIQIEEEAEIYGNY